MDCLTTNITPKLAKSFLLGSNIGRDSAKKAFTGGKLLTLCNAQKALDFDA
jgi:hypothetical protein